MHEDISAALEAEGIRPTIISAGKYKAEGNPFAPLADKTRAHIQERVDAAYQDFVGAVAQGRGVPVKTVANGYGEGRTVDAPGALRTGMIDRIATTEQTMARFVAPKTLQRRATAAQARARI